MRIVNPIPLDTFAIDSQFYLLRCSDHDVGHRIKCMPLTLLDMTIVFSLSAKQTNKQQLV